MSREGQLIFITNSNNISITANNLFLLIRESDDEILLEDGSTKNEKFIIGYIMSQVSGRLLCVSDRLTIPLSDVKYKIVGECKYNLIPQIIRL